MNQSQRQMVSLLDDLLMPERINISIPLPEGLAIVHFVNKSILLHPNANMLLHFVCLTEKGQLKIIKIIKTLIISILLCDLLNF